MKTRVNLNITTGYYVLNSGRAVNLLLSLYLNKKKRSSTECSSSKANPFFTDVR